MGTPEPCGNTLERTTRSVAQAANRRSLVRVAPVLAETDCDLFAGVKTTSFLLVSAHEHASL